MADKLGVIAEITPLGKFPVVSVENVGNGSERLDETLEKEALEVSKKADKTYVDAELNKKAAKSELEEAVTDLKEDLNYVTPEMFGAVGNGTTDDTDAIKQALSNSLSTNRQLVLKGGTYLCTSMVEIKNQMVIGSGLTQTTLKFTGNGYLKITGSGGYVGNFTISKDTGNDYLVVVDYINQAYKLENLRIHGSKNVMQIRNSWYATVKNIYIVSNDYTGNCLNLHATARGGVNNIDFSGIFTQRGYHAVEISKDADAQDNENIGFFNCTFEHCKGSVIKVCDKTINVTIDTAYMEDVAELSNTVVAIEGPTYFASFVNLRGVLVRVPADFAEITPRLPMMSGNVYCESFVSANYYTDICTEIDNVSYNNVTNMNTVNAMNINKTKNNSVNKTLVPNTIVDIAKFETYRVNTKLKLKITITSYLGTDLHLFCEKRVFFSTQGTGTTQEFNGDFYSDSGSVYANAYTVRITRISYDDERKTGTYKISINVSNIAILNKVHNFKIELEELTGKSQIIGVIPD